MKAYVMTRYGAPADVVQLRELADPVGGPYDVVIDIRAAALNPIDLRTIEGALKRINSYSMPHTLGFDASGVVRAIGENVSRFAVGDEVFVRASRETIGTFATRIALPEDFFASKPLSISHEAAASLPLVGLTTVQGLVDRAHAQAGQHILIHAGAGGVGSFAVQYAKHLGLCVTATTSARNADFVRGLGADEIIAYDKEDYRSAGTRFDIVFDTLGGDATLDAFRVTRRGGSVISIAGPPDRQFAGQVGAGTLPRLVMRFMARHVYKASRQYGVAYHRFLTTSNGSQLEGIGRLVERGDITPVIDQVFPFDRLHDALGYLATGRARGKVVLSMQPTQGSANSNGRHAGGI